MKCLLGAIDAKKQMALLRQTIGQLRNLAEFAAAACVGGWGLPRATYGPGQSQQCSWSQGGQAWYGSGAPVTRRKVAIAISGGVDSAVAALILKREG